MGSMRGDRNRVNAVQYVEKSSRANVSGIDGRDSGWEVGNSHDPGGSRRNPS